MFLNQSWSQGEGHRGNFSPRMHHGKNIPKPQKLQNERPSAVLRAFFDFAVAANTWAWLKLLLLLLLETWSCLQRLEGMEVMRRAQNLHLRRGLGKRLKRVRGGGLHGNLPCLTSWPCFVGGEGTRGTCLVICLGIIKEQSLDIGHVVHIPPIFTMVWQRPLTQVHRLYVFWFLLSCLLSYYYLYSIHWFMHL